MGVSWGQNTTTGISTHSNSICSTGQNYPEASARFLAVSLMSATGRTGPSHGLCENLKRHRWARDLLQCTMARGHVSWTSPASLLIRGHHRLDDPETSSLVT
ncbi:hypothetical protein MHYP_G00234520 [Metynnis hypsauchen]